MSRLTPVGDKYTSTKAQRVTLFSVAGGIIERRGYTPKLVNAQDVRITIAGALVEASLLYANHAVALADAQFLLVSNHVNEQGIMPWDEFVWSLSDATAPALMWRIADKVAAS